MGDVSWTFPCEREDVDNVQDLIGEFRAAKVWAVVGASDNKEKFGYRIWQHLLKRDKTAYPVNHRLESIDGIPVYKSLRDLPEQPEVVDLVVPAKVGIGILQECHELGIKNVWVQPGAESPELLAEGEKLGLRLVHQACAMREV